MPEQLKALGYETTLIGKWHVQPSPPQVGFDYSLYPRVHHRHAGQTFVENEPLHEARSDGGEGELVEGFSVDYEARAVRDYLDSVAGESKPFFLYYSISPPHMPLDDAPEEYLRMYSPSRCRSVTTCGATTGPCRTTRTGSRSTCGIPLLSGASRAHRAAAGRVHSAPPDRTLLRHDILGRRSGGTVDEGIGRQRPGGGYDRRISLRPRRQPGQPRLVQQGPAHRGVDPHLDDLVGSGAVATAGATR